MLLITSTTRTSLRDVERTCEGANASLPCRQVFFNAGKPCYWNEVRVNSNVVIGGPVEINRFVG